MSFPEINGVTTFLPAPAGYVVDFENPQRQANVATYWVAGIENFIALLFLGQRLYTRFYLSGGFQLDDIFVILSWLTGLVTQIIVVFMFAYPAGGIHAWEISLETFNLFMKLVYISAVIYIWCGALAKFSLLVFYHRLSPQRWYRMTVQATAFIILGSSTGIFFSLMFACRPMAMSWDITIPGECINRTAIYIATAVANIIGDLLLLMIPVPIVINLKIPRRQKYGLIFIFSIGSATLITSAVRASLLPALSSDPDQTWVISYASLWVIVEANLFVICSSMPTLRKFFRHVAPRIIGESTYGKSGNGKGGGYGKGGDRGTKRNATTGGTGGISTGGLKPTSSQLVTFGSSQDPRLAKYAKFDEDEDEQEVYVMATVSAVSNSKANNSGFASVHEKDWHAAVASKSPTHDIESIPKTRHARPGASGSLSWDTHLASESASDDNDSEKGIVPSAGIVQTRTVTVEYTGELGRKSSRR